MASSLVVVVPTFGNPLPKLDVCLNHIRKASSTIPVLVHDDASPDDDQVAAQCNLCQVYKAKYERRAEWGHMSGNYHDACVKAYNLWDPDVIVILQDDFVITKHWLDCLQYFWDHNWDKPVGTAGFWFAQAWELVSSGILERDLDFWGVDWGERNVSGSEICWNVEVVKTAIKEGRITTVAYPPLNNFEQVVEGGSAEGRFICTCCRGLHGTTNAHMSVRTSAFFDVGGMKGLPLYIFDLEFGWKLWEAGYWNVEVPGPIGLHFCGAGSKEAAAAGYLNSNDPKWAPYQWPRPEAREAFRQRWGVTRYEEVERKFLEDYAYPFSTSEECKNLKYFCDGSGTYAGD